MPKLDFESLVDNVKYAKTRLATAKANRKELNAALKLAYAIVKPTMKNNIRMSNWINGGDSVTVTARMNVDEIKGNKLLSGILSRAILCDNLTTEDTDDYVTDYCAERTFRFKGLRLNLNVEVRLNDGAPTCRKVKIGEEIQTVSKYAIVCD